MAMATAVSVLSQHLHTYMYISESSGERKLTSFNTKQHCSPKICKTWLGVGGSSAELVGCNLPGFLDKAVPGGSSDGNTGLRIAGQCRWHQDECWVGAGVSRHGNCRLHLSRRLAGDNSMDSTTGSDKHLKPRPNSQNHRRQLIRSP